MRDLPCLLHVGYMKTATTYLQAAVFDNAEAGFAVPMDGAGRALLVDQIILSDGFTFDPVKVAKRLDDEAKEVREAGLIPVWSDESLLGDPVKRRYDAHANASRLHQVLPDAKVLITIREQRRMVYSMYREYVRQGGRSPLADFVGTGNEPLSFSPMMRSEFLLFDRAVEHYQSLYGVENVLVLPQEMLARNRDDYLARLSNFLGNDIQANTVDQRRRHSSLGATATRICRSLNRFKTPSTWRNQPTRWERFLKLSLRLMDRAIPSALDSRVERPQRAFIDARYEGQFTESNRRLSELIDLDLSDLGYC